jgi:hypothetical protein
LQAETVSARTAKRSEGKSLRRLKRSLSLLSAAVLLAALLPRTAAPAFAADAPVVDGNTYTVELSYDDNIQINYQHRDGVAIDDWWRGNGDIPLGGASLGRAAGAIPQIYCVDAAVPFHSRVSAMGGTSAWQGGKSTDTVPNYVVASPEALPDALKAHWDELAWLAVNGYSDAASLTEMNSRYQDLRDNTGTLEDFDYDVAVMATKVAIWHFTNPDVAYFSTSFLAESVREANRTQGMQPQNTPSGVKHRQFVALAKRLVEDATAHAKDPAAKPLNLPQMELAIEKAQEFDPEGVAVSQDTPAGPRTVTYYGPYRITDNGALKIDDPVFLEMDGTKDSDFASIGFYIKNPNGSFEPIPGNLQKYGGDHTGSGIEKGKDFYIGVLAGRSLNGVSITALARATTQAAIETPVVLVHQNPETGEQDWDAVQAFIGLANANVDVTVYGQAILPLSSATGMLQVSKSGAGDIKGKEFSFKLTYANGNPVKLGDLRIPPYDRDKYSRIVYGDGRDGVFKLTAGTADAAFSWTLPLGEYKLTELSGADYKVSYRHNQDPPENGSVVSVSLLNENIPEVVRFTNTPIPPAPPVTVSVVKYSDDPYASVEGAAFLLEKFEGGYSGRAVVNAHGVAYFPQLPSLNFEGRYTLTEILPPANHTGLSDSISFQAMRNDDGSVAFGIGQSMAGTVRAYSNDDGALTFAIENTYVPSGPPPFTVFVVKHSDAGDASSVEGAVFALTKTDGSGGYSERAAVTRGVASFSPPQESSAGEYALTEESAPANHIGLSGTIAITVDETGTPSAIATRTDRASVVSYRNGGTLTLSVMNAYSPPPTPPTPGNPTLPEPPSPAPDNPEPPVEDTPPASPPETPSEAPPPPKLPQTGGKVGFGALSPDVLALLLAGAALILSPALRTRRKERGR